MGDPVPYANYESHLSPPLFSFFKERLQPSDFIPLLPFMFLVLHQWSERTKLGGSGSCNQAVDSDVVRSDRNLHQNRFPVVIIF